MKPTEKDVKLAEKIAEKLNRVFGIFHKADGKVLFDVEADPEVAEAVLMAICDFRKNGE